MGHVKSFEYGPVNRVFHKHTKMAIMVILVSEALLCETKETSSNKMLPQ